jgi:RNA polymerase sigma factor (sigma-70 family)
MSDINKNFNLSEEEFERMKLALQKGDESLLGKIFVARSKDVMQLLKTKYRAQHHDAYDAIIGALLPFRQNIIQGNVTYGNLNAYYSRTAIHIYLKMKGRSREDYPEEMPEIKSEESTEIFETERLDKLNEAWKLLGDFCRHLIQRYSYDGIPLKQIADEIGEDYDNLKKKKSRCVQKLKDLIQNKSD